MQNTLCDATEWARQEFLDAELGDVRRSRRLVRVAAGLARESHGTLPGSFGSWAELKAAYRLLDEPGVTYAEILQPHGAGTCSACRLPGEYLLVEDTTDLNFSGHEGVEGLGPIGDGRGRGMYVHSTLALKVHRWDADQQPQVTALGLLGQQCWVRKEPTGADTETKASRLSRARESQRWASVFARIGGPPAGARWTYIADRESDIFEVFERCQTADVAFIIRANQPRALADQDGSVLAAVGQAPVLGRFSIRLRGRPVQVKRPKRKGQHRRIQRPKLPGRTVELDVRACRVTLRSPWRPKTRPSSLDIHVVQVREMHPPEGAEPIEWVLLTSWPVTDLEICMRVVKSYSCRWLIEEYHKALKTGTGIEKSQLTSARRIQSLLAILAVVAVRLLDMKLLARVHPERPLEPETLSPEALAILEAKYGLPAEGWTYRNTLIAIARLGGFLARKSDGSPGWITIWRGWNKLRLMAHGVDMLSEERCG